MFVYGESLILGPKPAKGFGSIPETLTEDSEVKLSEGTERSKQPTWQALAFPQGTYFVPSVPKQLSTKYIKPSAHLCFLSREPDMPRQNKHKRNSTCAGLYNPTHMQEDVCMSPTREKMHIWPHLSGQMIMPGSSSLKDTMQLHTGGLRREQAREEMTISSVVNLTSKSLAEAAAAGHCLPHTPSYCCHSWTSSKSVAGANAPQCSHVLIALQVA